MSEMHRRLNWSAVEEACVSGAGKYPVGTVESGVAVVHDGSDLNNFDILNFSYLVSYDIAEGAVERKRK
eukprot:g76992.t1